MKNKLLILVIGLLITSCTVTKLDVEPSVTTISSPTTSSDKCLPPFEEFAFPIGDTDIMPPTLDPQLPPEEWKNISRVPGAFENGANQSIQLLMIRSQDRNTQIWVDGNNGELLRYDVQTQNWETIPASSQSDFFLASAVAFFDDGENLWAARKWRSDLIDLPLLMRYDDDKSQFVAVDLSIANEDDLSILETHLDSEGKVWMMVNDVGQGYQEIQLYSLDLATLEMEQHLIDTDLLQSFTVLQDDSVAVFNRQSKEYPNQSSILVYYPETKQFKEIRIPSSVYPYDPRSTLGPGLFLDSKSRLWLGDYGWVDLSEWDKGYYQWFKIVRSPVFIGMFVANPSWSWVGPYFDHETSDGKIWFDSPRGAGWVDLQGRIGAFSLVTAVGSWQMASKTCGFSWMVGCIRIANTQINN